MSIRCLCFRRVQPLESSSPAVGVLNRQTWVSSLPPRSTVPEQKANSLVFRLHPPGLCSEEAPDSPHHWLPQWKAEFSSTLFMTESCLQDGLPKFRPWRKEIVFQVWGWLNRRNNGFGFGSDFNWRIQAQRLSTESETNKTWTPQPGHF